MIHLLIENINFGATFGPVGRNGLIGSLAVLLIIFPSPLGVLSVILPKWPDTMQAKGIREGKVFIIHIERGGGGRMMSSGSDGLDGLED